MQAYFSLLYLSKNRYLYVIYVYTQIHTYISWKVKINLYIIFFPFKVFIEYVPILLLFSVLVF